MKRWNLGIAGFERKILQTNIMFFLVLDQLQIKFIQVLILNESNDFYLIETWLREGEVHLSQLGPLA